MSKIQELYQSGDWKAEKHVPVIEVPDQVAKGQCVTVEISVGKEIAHPNTTAHHIAWFDVFFLANGAKFPVQIGHFDLASHGASIEGADTSTIYTCPQIKCCFKTDRSGLIMVTSYCNIHGLWENSKTLQVS